jgi:hypothetical protein
VIVTTTTKPIDLARVRRGLAELDRLAQAHPELVRGAGTDPAEWERVLREAGMGEGKTQQLAIRLPVDLIDRIDRWAAWCTGELGGLAEVTRSDVVRVVLDRGLASLEADRRQDGAGSELRRDAFELDHELGGNVADLLDNDGEGQ